MMMDIYQLLDLEEALKKELDDGLTGILTRLNRFGQLEEFLELIGLTELLKSEVGYQVYKTGKIIVIGQSSVKKNVLLAIARKLNLDGSRFEFYLEYEDAKKFNFKNIQWKPTYSLIMVGPMPHSGISKGDESSIIAAIESEEGYPPIVRLGSNGLKITKSDFQCKLQEAIDSRKIA